jgi:hypothetical protein
MTDTSRRIDAAATLIRVAEACDILADAWMNGRPGTAMPNDDDVRDAVSALIDTIPASRDARIVELREGLDEAKSIIDMEMQRPSDVGRYLLSVSENAKEQAGWTRSLSNQAAETSQDAGRNKASTAHGPSSMPPFGATLARRDTGR